MNPSLQNMNLALAVIAFRALGRLNEIEFKSLSSNLTNFFSAIKEKLPEYEVQISKAIFLLGKMPSKEQEDILELVHSVSGTTESSFSPAKSAWSILKYISLFNKLFSYLQRPVADSISLCLSPLNQKVSDEQEFLCFGDIGLTTAFALALRGKQVDYVPFSASYQLSSEFLDLIVSAENKNGKIKRNIAVNQEGSAFSTNGKNYAGAFVFPNPDAACFNIEPFMKAISAPLVFLIPAPLLWVRTTEDRKLRKDLIGGNNLKAVIMLPPNSVSDSGCDFALLVLNTPGTENEVWFIDKSNQKTFLSRKRTLHDSLESFDLLERSENSSSASREELIQNDFNLNPKRYTSKSNDLFSKVKPENLMRLSEIVELIRAQEIPADEDNWTMTVKEVLPKDIDEIGLIEMPQKILLVAKKGEKRALQATLEEEDVILCIKSGNWKCGLWTYPDKRCTAGSCFVIFRVKNEFKKLLPPFYLMRLLRSSALQERFNSLSIGTRSPLLKMEDLRQIAFPLPSADEITQEKEKFEQQVKLLKEIRRKTKEIQELNMDI